MDEKLCLSVRNFDAKGNWMDCRAASGSQRRSPIKDCDHVTFRTTLLCQMKPHQQMQEHFRKSE